MSPRPRTPGPRRRPGPRPRGWQDRPWISQTLRQEVLVRDGGWCRYCGDAAETLDHVIPLTAGGDSTQDNLVSACQKCNSKKGAFAGFNLSNGVLRLEEWVVDSNHLFGRSGGSLWEAVRRNRGTYTKVWLTNDVVELLYSIQHPNEPLHQTVRRLMLQLDQIGASFRKNRIGVRGGRCVDERTPTPMLHTRKPCNIPDSDTNTPM